MEEELLTKQQRKSLELWVSQLSDELIANGYDLKHTLDYPIIPTRNAVREMIVKPVLYALTGYTTTKQIKKLKDLDLLYDTICKALGDRGVQVPPFPSSDSKNQLETYNNY